MTETPNDDDTQPIVSAEDVGWEHLDSSQDDGETPLPDLEEPVKDEEDDDDDGD